MAPLQLSSVQLSGHGVVDRRAGLLHLRPLNRTRRPGQGTRGGPDRFRVRAFQDQGAAGRTEERTHDEPPSRLAQGFQRMGNTLGGGAYAVLRVVGNVVQVFVVFLLPVLLAMLAFAGLVNYLAGDDAPFPGIFNAFALLLPGGFVIWCFYPEVTKYVEVLGEYEWFAVAESWVAALGERLPSPTPKRRPRKSAVPRQ